MTDQAPPSPPPTNHLHTKKLRAVVIPIHSIHGILLLHCTRKRKKGPHYQLPGGHMDDADLTSALEHTKLSPCSPKPQWGGADASLRMALRICAAREMYEETGIDVRDQLERLELARVGVRKMGESVTTVSDGATGVEEANKVCVFKKNRWYFCLDLSPLKRSRESDPSAHVIFSSGSHCHPTVATNS